MVHDPLSTRPHWQQAAVGFCILAFIILVPVLVPVMAPHTPAQLNAPVHVKILAVNDFHGQLPPGQTLNKRPVGGAPVLASYLKSAIASAKADRTIIALPGDLVGASPPESGLLLDEPAMLFWNRFAGPACERATLPYNPACTMVATPGNHKFDKGVPELLRKINGGNGNTVITNLADPYPGTRVSYVCANAVWEVNGTPVLPPYTIKTMDGVKIAFIGANTKNTPGLQMAKNVAGVTFTDKADAVNRYVAVVQGDGVHAIVVLLHEGGSQSPYEGPTIPAANVTGRVADIVARLDGDVDVVLSGHTHAFTNAYVGNAGGRPVLVTQAYSYSKGYADIDLVIDRASGDIVEKSAQVVPAYADVPPGTTPDPATAAFLAQDEMVVAPLTGRVIGVVAADITREQDSAGESALADLVTDTQRSGLKTDVAFATTGAIRADIPKGNVTWGNLYVVQPFSDSLVTMMLTGEQVTAALERQYQNPSPPHNLAVSGLSYTYDPAQP